MDLRGKAALVTGGSGDIGGSIAKTLAAAGVDVAISYIGNSERASSTVDAVQAVGRRSLAVQLDQRDPVAIDACVGKLLAEFSRIDILVNNAAWNIGIPFKGGRIVNIASLAGLVPGGSSIAYASSKAALIHLTHCLAVALAPDVTVNCIAPGLVEGTRMAERVPEEMKQRARSQAVLGRTGSAQDIAEQVVTFCRAETVTGQVLVVDGGLPGGMR